MPETSPKPVPVEEIIASMVDIKPTHYTLAQLLEMRGYEITPSLKQSGEGQVISIHSRWDLSLPRNAPTVPLVFSKEGLLLASGWNGLKDAAPGRAKLTEIHFMIDENEIEFTFEEIDRPEQKTHITLKTTHTRTVS